MTAQVWMGYLVVAQEDFTVIQSPFVLNGSRVYGADSDATTLAVAGMLHRLRSESVSSVTAPDGIDTVSFAGATGVPHHSEDATDEAPWDLLVGDEATVVLARQGATVELTALDVEIDVDADFHQAMEAAWAAEQSTFHVSQGAYVSRAQYEEAASSRLSLQGQASVDTVVWPPRYTYMVDGNEAQPRRLQRTGKVLSWTTLSAAGAPSEFSLRAPLLGGISTVFLQLDDGPKGVFLAVDDETPAFGMDVPMELVFRRLYAQEGFIRYGLKARTITD
ncbi:MAG: hypothetical protein VX524_03245 [Candidatus Thermoplasmatota archaeon]|nr:hypothetical protein [Candidatus Thermoplasmatota archaeon]